MTVALAVRNTTTPFSYFDYDFWNAFFAKLNPSCKVASSDAIVGNIHSNYYDQTAESAFDYIRNKGAGVLGMDRKTNRLTKSVSYVVFHLPQPCSIDYLKAYLKRKTTRKVVHSIGDVLTRLEKVLGRRAMFAFSPDSFNRICDVRR